MVETLLWALDLLALVYLCYWALRQDALPGESGQQGKSGKSGTSGKPTRERKTHA